jgi:hypothetical protein
MGRVRPSTSRHCIQFSQFVFAWGGGGDIQVQCPPPTMTLDAAAQEPSGTKAIIRVACGRRRACDVTGSTNRRVGF